MTEKFVFQKIALVTKMSFNTAGKRNVLTTHNAEDLSSTTTNGLVITSLIDSSSTRTPAVDEPFFVGGGGGGGRRSLFRFLESIAVSSSASTR